MHLYLVWYGTGSFVWLQKLHPCCALFLLQTQRYSLPRSDSELAFLNNDLVVERFKKQDKVMARPFTVSRKAFGFHCTLKCSASAQPKISGSLSACTYTFTTSRSSLQE